MARQRNSRQLILAKMPPLEAIYRERSVSCKRSTTLFMTTDRWLWVSMKCVSQVIPLANLFSYKKRTSWEIKFKIQRNRSLRNTSWYLFQPQTRYQSFHIVVAQWKYPQISSRSATVIRQLFIPEHHVWGKSCCARLRNRCEIAVTRWRS